MHVSFLHDRAGDSDENLIDGASQAEEKAIRFFSRFFHALLTNPHDKCIIQFDNDACQLVIEKKTGETEIINLDFVTRIREYPRKKNGKKKSIVVD